MAQELGSGDGKLQDFVIYTPVVASFLIFSFLLSLLVLLFCWKRVRMRRQIRLLVNDYTDNSYGSMTRSTSMAHSYQHNRRYSSLGKIKKPSIFILYTLELETFQKVTQQDYPTYSLVLDMANLLHALNLPCYHDGSESFQNDSIQDFSSKVSRAVTDAKAVIVICSEVLHTAFSGAWNNRKQAQMKFGKFNVSQVSKVMTKSTNKFVPVTLTGVSSVCSELQTVQCFNLKNYEQFMSCMSVSLNHVDVQSDPHFSEIREFAATLQKLVSDK